MAEPPRVTKVAVEVMREALRRAGKPKSLIVQIRSLVGREYADRTAYGWAEGTSRVPGDVLLAAAQATGISLDEKLGIGREPNEMEREIAELRTQMADLASRLDQLEAQAEGGEAGGSA